MSTPDPVARWLEGPEGEAWSRNYHRPAHAGESDLPNHIASIRPMPGHDPVWDRAPRDRPGPRDPQQDPSGRYQGPFGRLNELGDMQTRAFDAFRRLPPGDQAGEARISGTSDQIGRAWLGEVDRLRRAGRSR